MCYNNSKLGVDKMSFFNPVCCVCGQNAGILATGNKSLKMLCTNCRKKILSGTRYINCTGYTTEECIERVEIYDKNLKEYENFIVSKTIADNKKYMIIDEKNRKIGLYPEYSNSKTIPSIYSFDDIINFELLEDGNSIISGGLKRAIVGNMLMGELGAIVGGITGKRKNINTCSSLIIRISINDLKEPNFIISFIKTEIKKNSILYKQSKEKANECISMLEFICNNNENIINEQQNLNIDKGEEIAKYKSLLDSGAITEEEFNKLKTEIINKKL